MKKALFKLLEKRNTGIFVALFMILSSGIIAQDFAPIGAEWHYTEASFMSGDKNFFHIASVKDTLFHGKTCRKLVKTRDILCNMRPSTEYVYQEDSAVFFWQSDLTGFQILIDYKANSGDSWYIVLDDMESPSDIDSVLVMVDSTSVATINNSQLKVLWVTYTCLFDEPYGEMSYNGQIIEKIGDMYYLFNIFPELSFVCDGNYSEGLRCYEDDEVGFYSTGIADSCNYVYHWTDIKNNKPSSLFQIYPNPAASRIEIEATGHGNTTVELTDLTGGASMLTKEFVSHTQLDLPNVPGGIYLLWFRQNNQLTEVKKLVINQN